MVQSTFDELSVKPNLVGKLWMNGDLILAGGNFVFFGQISRGQLDKVVFISQRFTLLQRSCQYFIIWCLIL